MNPLHDLLNNSPNIQKFVDINYKHNIREPKIEFEFQELGIELEPFYGKKIWSLFHKPYFQYKDKNGLIWRSYVTEHKIRKAHEIAKNRKVKDYKYLIGIIKKLEPIQVT